MKMTKVLLAVLCGALCMGLIACGSSGGGGGAAAADAGVSVPIEGTWGTYDDHEPPNNGDSNITMDVVEMDGMPAYHFTGNTTNTYQYGFVGWYLQDFDEDTANALKSAKSVSFKVLGDGKRYTVKYRITGINDYAHFEYHFNTTAGEVLTITVPMRNFMQPSWGAAVRFRQENLMDIQWQTHEVWRPNTFEITVWDFQAQL